MLTQIEQDAMSAWDNEASTKGADDAAQGAYENACIYADTFGHDTDEFKQTLLSLYRGHINATK